MFYFQRKGIKAFRRKAQNLFKRMRNNYGFDFSISRESHEIQRRDIILQSSKSPEKKKYFHLGFLFSPFGAP